MILPLLSRIGGFHFSSIVANNGRLYVQACIADIGRLIYKEGMFCVWQLVKCCSACCTIFRGPVAGVIGHLVTASKNNGMLVTGVADTSSRSRTV